MSVRSPICVQVSGGVRGDVGLDAGTSCVDDLWYYERILEVICAPAKSMYNALVHRFGAEHHVRGVVIAGLATFFVYVVPVATWLVLAAALGAFIDAGYIWLISYGLWQLGSWLLPLAIK